MQITHCFCFKNHNNTTTTKQLYGDLMDCKEQCPGNKIDYCGNHNKVILLRKGRFETTVVYPWPNIVNPFWIIKRKGKTRGYCMDPELSDPVHSLCLAFYVYRMHFHPCNTITIRWIKSVVVLSLVQTYLLYMFDMYI